MSVALKKLNPFAISNSVTFPNILIICISFFCFPASLVAQTVKNLPTMWEIWVRPLGWEDHLEKGMQPVPVFLPGKFHGQRSLVVCSPWSHKELDMTKQLIHT